MDKISGRAILIAILAVIVITGRAAAWNPAKIISVKDLRDKIAAAWIGQMIGNIYGLPHENKYVTAPGPENWPYGYTKNLDKLKQYNGAFSDDDTDVEYMYLLQMSRFGPEPTYAQLREA